MIIAFAMALCALPTSAFADLQPGDGSELSHEQAVTGNAALIIERVDVSVEEARRDPTYLGHDIQLAKEAPRRASSSTTWKVTGHVQYSGTNNWYSQAVGRSGEYDGDTLLDTYHYTRTFFGSDSSPYGDSGRQWGSGDVWAFGSKVPTTYAQNKIHRVYYGTTA